ncbi:MAG: hypothetical protein P8L85_14005 [Rubripirellula sp.]|nr:hypothetical protein [Rubripirellula sp.]
MANDPFEETSTATNQMQTAPAKKGFRGCLIGCGVISLLGLLVCCGGGYYAMNFGTQQMANEIKPRLAGSPTIEEHIGDVDSLSVDLIRTYTGMAEAQKKDDTGALILQINGSKGDGEIHLMLDETGQVNFDNSELVLPDDSRYPLDLSLPSDDSGFDADDLDMNLEDLIDTGESVTAPPTFEAPTGNDSPNR